MKVDYIEWDGDWCKRPPATLEKTTLHLLPMLANSSSVLARCQERFDTPSTNHVQVKPLASTMGKSLVILVVADLPRIKSKDPQQSVTDGYIAEHDVGIFVPVRYSVAGVDQGIGVFIPYLYVDNAAAVVMGREIHGFPKILAAINYAPGTNDFDVSTLVFPATGPDVLAENREIIRIRRNLWGLPLISPMAKWLEAVKPAMTDLGSVAKAVLASVGIENLAVKDFNEVTFLFLKQMRSVLGHPGCDFSAITAVPGAVVSIPSAVQVDVWPLAWPLRVTFTDYPGSVNIAAQLGLPTTTDILTSFRVTADLEIRDGTVL